MFVAGEYLPISLTAGSVVFRVPAVWHAVRPIHRLRRYATARYYVTDRPVAAEGYGTIHDVVERRQTEEGRALTDSLPEDLRRLCDPDAVRVTLLASTAGAAAARL